MPVPYIFANQTGNISLSELDANFANVKAAVETANIVTSPAQPAITTVGQLISLTVAGNIRTLSGGVYAPAYYWANGVPLMSSAAAATYGNANVAAYLPTYNGALTSLTGNVTTIGSINAANGVFAGTLTSQGNIQGENLVTNGAIYSSRNITGGNLVANNSITGSSLQITGGDITAFGNVSGGNFATTGNITVDQRAQAGSFLTPGTVQGSDLYSTNLIRGANLIVSASASVAGNLTVSTGINLPAAINVSATPSAAVNNTITHKLPITINGTVYYIALTSNV